MSMDKIARDMREGRFPNKLVYWPGTCISDGAFDVLRQVAEYNVQRKRRNR